MRILLQFLNKLAGTVLYLFSFCFPRSSKIWVFGAWYGKNYSDNSKYFFKYVNENENDITAVWITKSAGVVKSLTRKGYKVFHINSIQGIYYSLRAKYGIISSGTYDINPFLTGNMVLIQLWHGIPLKKIMYDDKLNLKETRYTRFLEFIFPYRKAKYSMLIATSEEVQAKMSQAFRVNKRDIKVTGFPRNEAFYNDHESYSLMDEIKGHRTVGKSVGIYLPTFRDEDPDQYINEVIECFKEIDNKLDSVNCIIYVKMHYMHLSFLEEKNIEFKNFKVIQDSEIQSDIYPILRYTDFLISDYSSIYFDYLLLRKPIVFFPFDIETYISKSRELYYDYEDVTPGVKAFNAEQLLTAISDTINMNDNHKGLSETVTSEFHKDVDGNYSERLFREIVQLNSK